MASLVAAAAALALQACDVTVHQDAPGRQDSAQVTQPAPAPAAPAADMTAAAPATPVEATDSSALPPAPTAADVAAASAGDFTAAPAA
ncbi:MAG TPA: flagellar hook-length control protein FliK, partial [Ramlibacter sp.]|nr:flagellar hook-length control protein FliK [Ramlibacter sp.]